MHSGNNVTASTIRERYHHQKLQQQRGGLMKWSVAFFSLATLCIATSARAADLPVKTQVDHVYPYTWTGFYVGGHAGYMEGFTQNDSTFLPNGRASSWFVGVQGGYRYQLPNNFVIGGQIAAPLWGKDQSLTVFGVATTTAKFKGAVIGQGILGYAMGRFLPYGTLGIGKGRVEAQEVIPGAVSNVVRNTHTLYTAGFGMKYAVTDHVSVGIGYNHLTTSSEPYDCGPVVCGIVGNIKLNADSVAGSLDYKF